MEKLIKKFVYMFGLVLSGGFIGAAPWNYNGAPLIAAGLLLYFISASLIMFKMELK